MNTTTLRLSVFAELERWLIGERTKAASAVKQSQGVVHGRPRTLADKVVERIVRERARLSMAKLQSPLVATKSPRLSG